MTKNITGNCLCGAVTVEITPEPITVAHCYCVDCRKASGTGHCTHIVVPQEALRISGEVKYYDHPADSGNIVSRGFCPNCGGAICNINSGMPGMIFPRASMLDDPDTVTPQMSVYASRAPSWDPVDPNLPSFAEMPEKT